MEALLQLDGALSRENFPLSRISFVGTRGRTRLYLRVFTEKALVDCLNFLMRRGVPFVVCGMCSNILWGDGFFRGVVVDTRGLGDVLVEGERVICECGVSLSRFVKTCAVNFLAGAEELWGIPGTVGGAVVMNAGAFGRCMGELVEWVECWVNGEVVRLKGQDVEFSYRHSSLTDKIVMRVGLKLARTTASLFKKMSLIASMRRSRFPSGLSLGSVFKNPLGLYAGRLIEEAGLKGYNAGQVRVSDRHANFILSSRAAGASDYIGLVNFVKEQVFRSSGVLLSEEIVYAGAFR